MYKRKKQRRDKLMVKYVCLILISWGLLSAGLKAQQPSTNETQSVDQTQAHQQGSVPVYRITVIGRTVKAINYRHLSGSTKIDFVGTALLAQAHGTAEVRSRAGATDIDLDLKNLRPATKFGPEYLTYVLWAITPDGRPVNLGEVLLNGDRSKLHVTTSLQAFGMIITAEPYFAVTRPSDVVVMENQIRPDTVGKIEEVNAKFELLRRGQYTANANSSEITPLIINSRTPLQLYEARNAVRIAKWAGADRYASDTFAKARQELEQAEDYLARRQGKPVLTAAREAAQTAEDARVIALRKQRQEQIANEQQAAAERAAAAKAQAEAEKERAERAREQAEAAARARAQAEAARAAAEVQQQQAQAEAARAQQEAQQAVAEKEQMRARLLQQLNAILQTRDTPRGLVVTMSDVLFATGKYTLRPDAREKLAKMAGVLLTYPNLKLEIDGYTDSTGSESVNQELSEKRADAVRDYLAQQGVPVSSMTPVGMGASNPVASNDTAAGRKQNRRVEVVITGNAIGAQAATTAPVPNP
jgi:outer membrane protein OmpA-like peptidoglycan-associated protein